MLYVPISAQLSSNVMNLGSDQCVRLLEFVTACMVCAYLTLLGTRLGVYSTIRQL